MIRINLLPHHSRIQHRKHASTRMQLAIEIGVVCLTMTLCWIWGTSLSHQRDRLRQENISQEQQLATMEIQRQARMKRKVKQDLQLAHAQFLSGYQDKKFAPILALGEISKGLVPLGIWLRAVSIDHRGMAIEGNALSTEDIGHFIGNLETSLIVGELAKMESHPQHINGNTIQQFTLQYTTQR